ncbi:hypothetical protein Tco_1477484, partial [Tanacetum coccineum]
MIVALGIIVWASLPCSGRHELARVMFNMTDLIDDYNILDSAFGKKNWRFISWRARWPTDGIIVGAQFSIKTLLAGSETSTSQTICNRCPYSKQGTVSKFVKDYQDFDHRGFPNMGHGGGGPHGGASRGGGRHGGNFRRSGDSSRSGATHPFNSGGVSRGCG